MPYFSLIYSNTSEITSPPSFIVQETVEVLTPEKIQNLTLLVKDIFARHLHCISVPTSFPLEPFHTNTLYIIQDVLYPLIGFFNEIDISPINQNSTANLISSINLNLSKATLSEFIQPLPTVITLTPEATFSKEIPRSRTPKSKSPIKRALSPPLGIIPEKKQFSPSSNHNDETYLKNILIDYKAPLLNIDPSDFLPKTSTSSCSIIEIIENTKSFKIVTKEVSDISGALQHLHQGIQYVLDKEIYAHSEDSTSFQSKAHAHYSSLSILLSLLKKHYILLDLISDENECQILTKEHDILIQDISISLHKEELKNLIDLTKKTAFIKDTKSSTPTQELCLQPETSILSPQLINSPKCSNNEDKPISRDSKQISLNSKNILLNLKKVNNDTFKIIINTTKIYPSSPVFSARIVYHLQNSRAYTCEEQIKELLIQSSDKKSETLKALYLITRNNYLFYKNQGQLRTQTKNTFLSLLDKINIAFCQEMQLKIFPNEHSSILLQLLPSITITSPSTRQKPCSFSHYHMRFHSKNKIKCLTIEIQNYPSYTWQDLIKSKLNVLKKMLKTIQTLSSLKVIAIRANNIIDIKDGDSVPTTSLIPKLHILIKYNIQIFRSYRVSSNKLPIRLKSCLNILTTTLKTLESIYNDKDLSNSEPLEANNPLCKINIKSIRNKKIDHIISPLFTIKNKNDCVHLLYINKSNGSSQELKYLTSKLLLSLDPLPLFNTPLNKIIFFKDPFHKEEAIQTTSQLLQILHNGFTENLLFYTENKEKLLTKKKKEPILKNLEYALDKIKIMASNLNIELSSIKEASILNNLATCSVLNTDTKQNDNY